MLRLKETVGTFLDRFTSHAKGGSVLGVDVSSSTIKVVQLRREGGRAILETYGELALGPYAGVTEGKATRLSTTKIAEALKDLMKESQVTTKNCGVAIPLSSSLINVISLPDLGEKKMKEMVPIEVRKYIPVSISEVMLDWNIIPNVSIGESAAEKEDENKRKEVEVLTVAIHNDTITKYQTIVREAELNATFFEIEVFSTVRSVLVDDVAPVMVMDMGAGVTKILIVDRRVLRESHTISRGSQDMTVALTRAMNISSERAEELKRTNGLIPEGDQSVIEIISLTLDTLLADAERVVLKYQKKYNRTVGKVVLTGGGALLKGLPEKVSQHFGITAIVGDPFAKVQTPAFLEEILKEVGPEFSVAIGVALRKLEETL
jgi:type IV pilus assembly protein PilM